MLYMCLDTKGLGHAWYTWLVCIRSLQSRRVNDVAFYGLYMAKEYLVSCLYAHAYIRR